jgi:hypothetical protein
MHLFFYGAGSNGFLAGNSGPTPITGPSNAYFPPEIHYLPLHKKNRSIGNFMYMSFRAHNSLSVCQEELERALK